MVDVCRQGGISGADVLRVEAQVGGAGPQWNWANCGSSVRENAKLKRLGGRSLARSPYAAGDRAKKPCRPRDRRVNVDHAIFRIAKGAVGLIKVEGPDQPDIYKNLLK